MPDDFPPLAVGDQRYLEDFEVGQSFATPESPPIGEAAIIDFARQWDPQLFHLDDAAARDTLFAGLAASGWHTAAMTMRLLLAGDTRIAGGLIAGGIEAITWPRPVRPGDRLRCATDVLEVRRSASKPDRGILKLRTTTTNQHGQPVQIMTSVMMVPRRHPGD
ncbi:MAG TPA: MaoC family dehydratase [Stellaceae bacterium]|nr:MaoC family dehydratase [Stellaceae bacterium]